MTRWSMSVTPRRVMSGDTSTPRDERPLLGKWPGNRATSVCLLTLFRRSAGVAADSGKETDTLGKTRAMELS